MSRTKSRVGVNPYNIRQLSFGNQVLRFGANKFLLEHYNPSALGLLHLQFGNLVGNLIFAVSTGLNALLRIANGLQNPTGIIERMSILLLLLAKLAKNDTDLVRDVGDCLIVGLLAPFGKLGGDGGALAASRLVGGYEVVLALDEAVELA